MSLSRLARLALVDAARVELEDHQILQREVREVLGVVSDGTCCGGEVGAEPVGDQLHLHLPAARVSVEDGSGSLDEGAHRVAEDFLLDSAGGRALAHD